MKNILTYFFVLIALLVKAQTWNSVVSSARDAYKKGDFERSIRLYQSAEKQKNKSKNIASEIGQAAYRSGDFVAAQTYFEKATKDANKPRSAAQFHNLGNSLMKQKKYSEAISAYKQALRLSPNDIQTQYNLSEAIRKNKNKPNNSPDNQNNNPQPPQPKNNNSDQPSKKETGKNDQKLPSKSADRLLDQLMKAEAETKRKLAGSKQKGTGNSSGKDW